MGAYVLHSSTNAEYSLLLGMRGASFQHDLSGLRISSPSNPLERLHLMQDTVSYMFHALGLLRAPVVTQVAARSNNGVVGVE
jgi:hypothetical protein